MENKYFRGVLSYGSLNQTQSELKDKLNELLKKKKLLSVDSKLGFYFDYCYYIQDKRIEYYKKPIKDDMKEVSLDYFEKWLSNDIYSEPIYDIY